MKALTLIFTFCIIVAFSQATPAIVPRPQLNETFKVNHTQQLQQIGSCNYLVYIKTSCISPSYTTDQISLLFGDAYGNQLYVPRLDDISPDTFLPCLTDVFEVTGACIGAICNLYLYRSGIDGWVPERVTVYDYIYEAITFEYNINFPIPEGGGYGFDHCG